MYVFTVYASRTSQRPLNQHLWIRCGMCFWDCQSMHAQGVWKVWEGEQSVHTMLERVSRSEHGFKLHRRIWSFLKTTTCFICFARRCWTLLYSSFPTQTSRHYGCIYALCLLFHFCARLQALSSSLPTQFLPFWCCDNETANAATVLRMINLRKCTQLFVNRIF